MEALDGIILELTLPCGKMYMLHMLSAERLFDRWGIVVAIVRVNLIRGTLHPQLAIIQEHSAFLVITDKAHMVSNEEFCTVINGIPIEQEFVFALSLLS